MFELGAVDLLAGEEGRLARVLDLDLLQHLADDHLDVLVVDAHALQPVDLLDLVDQVARQLLDPKIRRMSCGTRLPSINRSPLWT